METLNLVPLVGGGGDASVAGADKEIQYNDGGALGASADLTWDDTAKELGVGGDINLDDGGTYETTVQVVTPTANRTISFPDATGTVALVAGSSGSLIYNNAGAYAGVPGATVGSSGNITLNASSGFSGNLIDAQTNGTSIFSVGSVGNTSTAFAWRIGASSAAWAPYGGAIAFGATGGNPAFTVEGSLGAGIPSAALLWWSSNPTTGAYSSRDVVLARDAAGTLAQRNGTNAQTFRVYNTYTSSTNYELGKLEWGSNVFRIGTEKGSAGGTARALEFQTDGTPRATIDTSGRLLVGTTSSTASTSQTARVQVAGSIRATSGLASSIELGEIAQNATASIALPEAGGLYVITISGMNLTALFLATTGGGSQGVRLIYSTGSDVVAGLTSEPAGGTYLRLWIDSSTGQLQVKNVNFFTGPYCIAPLVTA